ncbi:hypothetical protein AMTR_s00121p00012300, partial [Amborella trichopoda]
SPSQIPDRLADSLGVPWESNVWLERIVGLASLPSLLVVVRYKALAICRILPDPRWCDVDSWYWSPLSLLTCSTKVFEVFSSDLEGCLPEGLVVHPAFLVKVGFLKALD